MPYQVLQQVVADPLSGYGRSQCRIDRGAIGQSRHVDGSKTSEGASDAAGGDNRRRVDDHQPLHALRSREGEPHRGLAAHAVADENRPLDGERVEQGQDIARQGRIGDVGIVERAAVVAQIGHHDPPLRCELAGDPHPVGRGAEQTVQQHQRSGALARLAVMQPHGSHLTGGQTSNRAGRSAVHDAIPIAAWRPLLPASSKRPAGCGGYSSTSS